MHADSVRVVGTNALRRAKRKRWFLERARAALGHPIEIISGLEEARLIYSGVAHTSPMSPDKRLVIDIGGGSTEVVIGEGFNPLAAREPVGGLRRLDHAIFRRRQDIREALRACADGGHGSNSNPFRKPTESSAGCRHSAVPVRCASLAMSLRRLNPDSPRITLDNLRSLADRVIAAGHVDDLDLAGRRCRARAGVSGGARDLARDRRELRRRPHTRRGGRHARGPALRPDGPIHR